MTCGGFIFIYIQKRIYYPLPHDIICCPLKCFMGVRMFFVKCKSGKSTEKNQGMFWNEVFIPYLCTQNKFKV